MNQTLENKLKITAFNGSPRGSGLKGIGGGNTHWMVEAFLKGAEEAGAEIKNILLAEKKIKPCRGDFHCWFKHPGNCYLNDDMEGLREEYFSSDIVVLASPIHADNVTPTLLTFIGRLLPMCDLRFEKDGNRKYKREYDTKLKDGFFPGLLKLFSWVGVRLIDPYKTSSRKGEYRHQIRNDSESDRNDGSGPDLVMLANVGLPEQSHFQVVDLWIDRYARNAHSKVVGKIYRGMGELLTGDEPKLRSVIRKYQQKLNQAGKELVETRMVSEKTSADLQKALVPMDLYAAFINDVSKQIEQGKRFKSYQNKK